MAFSTDEENCVCVCVCAMMLNERKQIWTATCKLLAYYTNNNNNNSNNDNVRIQYNQVYGARARLLARGLSSEVNPMMIIVCIC